MNYLDLIIEGYNCEAKKIPQIHKERGGGKARSASGVLFENLIQEICLHHNLVAKKNDYKKSREILGCSVNNLQVDKHIYRNLELSKFLESKAYLDACYLKRAVLDFIMLHESPDVSDEVDYAILCGQDSVSKDTINYCVAFFKDKTNKDLDIFVINKVKKRNSSKAIYMEKYSDDFQLDIDEVNRFVRWLNK
jgi:hypothetical protein